MKRTKRAGPKLRPKSTRPVWRKHTLRGKIKREPAEIGTFDDFPHLQNGGKWNAKDGKPKRRVEEYLGLLRSLGMSEVDAKMMVSNLYWDCWTELLASGRRPEEFSTKWEPQVSSFAYGVMCHAIRRMAGATK